MSLSQTDFCKKQSLDPEDPRCARVVLTGKIKRVSSPVDIHFIFITENWQYFVIICIFFKSKIINFTHIQPLKAFCFFTYYLELHGNKIHVHIGDYMHYIYTRLLRKQSSTKYAGYR